MQDSLSQWKPWDARCLRRAFRLAVTGVGLTHPNPMVGAVVARDDGWIVGEGVHRYRDRLHAEPLALAAAGESARGADLYVSLEPCAHQGRTPPCTRAILEAGIRRVVVGCQDPNPLVAGRGVETLRQAGVRVQLAPDSRPFADLNRAFNKYIQTGTPWVSLKAGLSLDGRIAPASGRARWVTGEAARRRGHFLRFAHDAILAGVGTVLADDPELTCRYPRVKDTPLLRVILDSQARIPLHSRLVRTAGETPLLVGTTAAAPPERLAALRERGVEVVLLPASAGRVAVDALLAELGRRQVVSVLVEGGGQIHAAFLSAQAVDEFHFFYAPRFLGGDGFPVVSALGCREIAECPVGGFRQVGRLGEDLYVRGRLV